MLKQLQIDQMTTAEKLRVMEQLWEDLRTRADCVSGLQWHKDLLDERARLIETGEAQFNDWDAARKRISERTS